MTSTATASRASDTPALERFAGGFSFPTSLAFGDDDELYVAESGVGFAGAPHGGRVWRLDGGSRRTLVLDDLPPPVNGLCVHAGRLYVSAGDAPGRICRYDLRDPSPAHTRTVIVDDLPGPGNYHVNTPVVGPDGRLYFSQGAMTNSAIVGLDAYELRWLDRLPHAHDVPGLACVLAGVNATTAGGRNGVGPRQVTTGAFVPFGTATTAGQRVEPRLPCTAAVMRCDLDGGNLELVAWGLRNAYGLGFLPDGRLLAIDQGADDRGSRPIGHAPDLLFALEPGMWCGWPDFIGGVPVTDGRFRPTRGPAPASVLANHDELPPPAAPVLEFPVNAAAVKFACAPRPWPAGPEEIFVALFGDERPMTGPAGPRVGRSVARIDPTTWTLHPFLDGPWHRPIDVRFHPRRDALFILDFGAFEMLEGGGVDADPESGTVWVLRDTQR